MKPFAVTRHATSIHYKYQISRLCGNESGWSKVSCCHTFLNYDFRILNPNEMGI
jgi:hypothetical protein